MAQHPVAEERVEVIETWAQLAVGGNSDGVVERRADVGIAGWILGCIHGHGEISRLSTPPLINIRYRVY